MQNVRLKTKRYQESTLNHVRKLCFEPVAGVLGVIDLRCETSLPGGWCALGVSHAADGKLQTMRPMSQVKKREGLKSN